MTDEEWNQAIVDLFGSNIVSLGNSRYTADECIGFARQLMTGEDPHRSQRLSLVDANNQNPALADALFARTGDLMPMMFIIHNVLSIPPSQREAFWSSPIGKQTLSSIIYSITEGSEF